MNYKYTYTAQIERDTESGLYIGFVPSLPGAHTQAETIEELYQNLQEVVALCIEELSEDERISAESQFVGTHQICVTA